MPALSGDLWRRGDVRAGRPGTLPSKATFPPHDSFGRNMDVIGRGIIAGFLATLALSAIFGPMANMARMAGVLLPTFGWLLHLLVGSFVWGAAFALVRPLLPGASWLRGLLFGFGAWLIVMLTVMPLTHAGWFGISLGVTAPLVMLAVHLVYGALLGAIFTLLDPDGGPHGEEDHFHDHFHPLPR
jgi:hypothetical protein